MREEWVIEACLACRYLLSLKSDPNSLNDEEWSPLHSISYYCMKSDGMEEILVESGSNVQAKDNLGKTALHDAAYSHNKDIEIIEYLG